MTPNNLNLLLNFKSMFVFINESITVVYICFYFILFYFFRFFYYFILQQLKNNFLAL